MDTDVIGSSATTTTAAAARFWPLLSSGLGPNTAVAASQSPMGAAGTVKNLSVSYETAPGVGLTRTFTVYKNGVATAVTGTTAANGRTATDLVNTVSFVAGDTLSLVTTASGATTGTGAVHWTVAITSAANVSHISTVSDTAVSNAATNYISLQGGGLDAVAANVEITFPTAGTIKNMYVVLNGAPTAGKNFAFTLVQAGSPTTLTVTIADTATTGNDVTHSVPVAAGDKLYIQCVPTGTPTARSANIGVEFDPAINGESVQCFGSGTALSTTVARVMSVNGMTAPSATDSLRTGQTQTCVIRNMYVALSAAPGAAKTYVLQVSVNGAPGNPTVSITGAASQSGNDLTNSVNVNLGDLVNYRVVPTGTPTAAAAEVSVVTYIAPPSTGSTLLLMGIG